jgi:dTMP kinase
MYITFEGPEATGKSTQVQRLAKNLEEKEIKVLITKEPGSPHDRVCTAIRKVLLNPGDVVHDRTALLLFLADRAQYMAHTVIPALRKGYTVLSDRSSLSTLVYHLASKKEHWDFSDLDKKHLAAMMNFAQPVEPDLCFVARSDYGFSKMHLLAREQDRIELKGDSFHDRVHMYFESFVLEDYNKEAKFFENQKFFPKKVIGLPQIPHVNEDGILAFVLRQLEYLASRIEVSSVKELCDTPCKYPTHNLD